jgi:hypothetical protein
MDGSFIVKSALSFALEPATMFLLMMCLLWAAAGCNPRLFAADPKTTGDTPSTNASTTSAVEGVPYCPGGDRASACVFGANCRVTEAGCQVCQCLSPP